MTITAPPPVVTETIEVDHDQDGDDPYCHILGDNSRPLCGKQLRKGSGGIGVHSIPGNLAAESPCVCGAPRCPECAARFRDG